MHPHFNPHLPPKLTWKRPFKKQLILSAQAVPRSRSRSTHLEEALKHAGQRKVRPQLLLVQVVPRLAQPLSPERHVPPEQLLGAALQLGELSHLTS